MTAEPGRPDVGQGQDIGKLAVARGRPSSAADVPQSLIRPASAAPVSLLPVVSPGTNPVTQIPPLPGGRSIARALRPFKRHVDSRQGQLELDEEATAQRAAQDGLWLPECRPVQERWLDLILVMDDSRFAAFHQP